MPTSQDTQAPNAGPWDVSAVFFDLDGTLVDPAGGITGGIAQALAQHGLTVPGEDVLRQLVGPPLPVGLSQILNVPQDMMTGVIASYRSWYATHGFAASQVYPGVTAALEALRSAGARLAVTTSKPQSLAKRLLGHHGLEQYFESVMGSPDDEGAGGHAGSSKEPQVRAAARGLGVAVDTVAVVGDRRYDIEAAAAVGALGLGVTWGFAEPGELERAGASAVITRASDLPELLHAAPVESPSPNASKETV